MDRGFFLTLQAMRRQLAAMPCDYYQIRLIHGCSRRPFPGDHVWSALQLSRGAMVRFLRLRNREGYDVFFQPLEGDRNAGYILVDLDRAEDNIIDKMRANGHEPCVVLRTSPGHGTRNARSACVPHLQAWVCVSLTPLEPAVATSRRQTSGWSVRRRSRQRRWASFGKAGRIHQSKTHTPSVQRLRPLGETRARSHHLGYSRRLSAADRSAPLPGSLPAHP